MQVSTELNRGSSLIEILVAMGVFGFVLIGIAAVTSNLGKARRQIGAKDQFDLSLTHAAHVLGIEANATRVLANQVFDPTATGGNPVQIAFAPGETPFLQQNLTVGNGSLQYTKVTLNHEFTLNNVNFTVTVGGGAPTEYTNRPIYGAKLVVEAQQQGSTVGSPVLKNESIRLFLVTKPTSNEILAAVGPQFFGQKELAEQKGLKVNVDQTSGLSSVGTYENSGTWVPITDVGAPLARHNPGHTLAGNKLVIWGGHRGGTTDTGGVFDLATNTWTSTTSVGAPSSRSNVRLVWTGTYVLTGGGCENTPCTSVTNTGGRYDPTTDTWFPITIVGAPPPSYGYALVWAGNRMVYWGGYDDFDNPLNVGGRYDPLSDTWTAMTTLGAPSGRRYVEAAWTGSKIILWGSGTTASQSNTGGMYDPLADSWTSTTTFGSPIGKSVGFNLVWAGNSMIVWGGNTATPLNTGGIYFPNGDYWRPMTTSGAPSPRVSSMAAWTGTRFIVWAGWDVVTRFNTGGKYNPDTDSWSEMTTSVAPNPRLRFGADWTGTDFIIWGGDDGTYDDTGGRYTP
jgi:hypothetical protein